MDNLTHSLVGLATAKAGLERLSPYATAVCVIGANLPDADIIARLWGSWFYLEHHRGITHSIVGVLMLALMLPLVFYASDWLVARISKRERKVKLAGLVLASLVALVTHPLLDWTNSYGVRPLLPFDASWFYGDLVFIVDPFIWLNVGGAAFLLTARTRTRAAIWATLALLITLLIFVLPQRNGVPYPFTASLLWVLGLSGLIAAHRLRFAANFGNAVAVAALALVVAYWGALAFAHRQAYLRAESRMNAFVAGTGEQVQRLAATPVLADPLRWTCLAETNAATYRFDVRLVGSTPAQIDGRRYAKPSGAAAFVQAVSADERARIFLDFARFPVAQIERNCAAATLVQFADLRYTEPGASERGNFRLNVSVQEPTP